MGTKITTLSVRVIPRSRKNEIGGILPDGTVKIRLAAPPIDGKANQALVRFLSEFFAVPVSSIKIETGLTARNKVVSIQGFDPETARLRLMGYRG